MDVLRLPSVMENSQRILVAGAGGGFDVYAGIPIYERLRSLGKEVFLANLSFVHLGETGASRLTRALFLVEPATPGPDFYFPERTLARFFFQQGRDLAVYAFEKLGVAPIREGYAHLVELLDLDAIVLVDGGTDILLRGDECGLGTPAEDMASLAAVASASWRAVRYCALKLAASMASGACLSASVIEVPRRDRVRARARRSRD